MIIYSCIARLPLQIPDLHHGILRACAPWRRCLVTLAIETSCDDTSVAILEKDDCRKARDGPLARLHFHKRITANNSAYRGIHPIASLDSHERVLSQLVQEAITHIPARHNAEWTFKHDLNGGTHVTSAENAKPKERKPDFVSVTRGPGMRSSLNVGLNTAKGLALAWNIPLLGVHHMQAHALTPRLVSALSDQSNDTHLDQYQPSFPFLTLLVSGGHTLLLSSQSLTSHPILATTSDIALGDCIDKIARFVVPEYVIAASKSTAYGPLLESFAFPENTSVKHSVEDDTPTASQYQHNYEAPPTRAAELERKMTAYGWGFGPPLAETKSGKKSRSMEYSFTGLLSSVKRISERRLAQRATLRAEGATESEESDLPLGIEERQTMAREAMRVAFEHLAGRVIFALEGMQPVRSDGPAMRQTEQFDTLVVSGGVAANKFLKTVLRSFLNARGYSHINLVFPPLGLCSDNAAMIGWAGMEMYEAGWESELSCQSIKSWSLDPTSEDGGVLGARGWKRR